MDDVVVVGAGFAGLACAKATVSRGLRTTVLERKPRVGASPHTTGLLVQEVLDAWDVPRAILRRVPGVRLYAPSLQWIDLESPGYAFYATDTPALLEWLARESGARILTGHNGVRPPARWLVGADGPRSSVAREHGLGVNREFLAGAEWEFDGVRGVEESRLHCFLDSRLAPGYIGWVVPGVHHTQVGLACRRGTARVAEFVRRVSHVFDFARARVVSRRGGLIPVGGPVTPFARDGVVLVGDAAGLVSPLTGGGIHTALESGRRVGEAIAAGAVPSLPQPSLWKLALRAAMDVRWPNALFDAMLPLLRPLARAVFYARSKRSSSEASLAAIDSSRSSDTAAPSPSASA